MKGPSDLSDILSGIKTKKISVNTPTQSQSQPSTKQSNKQPTKQTHQQQTHQQQQTRANQDFDELDFDEFDKKSEDDDEKDRAPAIKLTSLSTIDHALNDSSRISLDDMKSIEGDFNVPKKSKRRPKSDKNTINLDL